MIFDVDPFTESTPEQVLDYIEHDLLGNIDPFMTFLCNKRAKEQHKELTKQLDKVVTEVYLYKLSQTKEPDLPNFTNISLWPLPNIITS